MVDLVKLLGAMLLACLAGNAGADSLPDPTRPPTSIAGPIAGSGDSEGLRLQSVILPAQGRPMAVINGQMVGVGDRVGDGRLTRITESEAVVAGSQGMQRLLLTPDVDKVSLSGPAGREKKNLGKKRENP